MKHIPNFPVWLSVFMLLGPFLLIFEVFYKHELAWLGQIAGALMVMVALFYLAKRLHEQTEDMASLREELKGEDDQH